MDKEKKAASDQGGKAGSWWNRFIKKLAEAQSKSSRGCSS